MLSLSNTLDVQPLLTQKLSHQTSCRRYLLDKMPKNYQMIQFGLDGARVSQTDLEYFNMKITEANASASLKWMREARTEGVLQAWISIIDNLVADETKKHLVHLSINLESIEGLKGVSSNCLSGGIATEDAV